MGRVKVTGYFTPEPDEVDDNSPTGLTEEAYMNLIMGEDGIGLKVADLDEVDVEVDDA